MTEPQRILVLAPHTDDGELGAGGTIARWCREGREVHYVAFSGCESSVPAGFPSDVLRHESAAATSCLGVPAERFRVLDFDVRHFGSVRQDILQTMVDLDRELTPDLVVLPSTNDLHQDHGVVAIEGVRAFKRRSVLAYEIPWNNLEFRAGSFVHLDEEDVERKVEALGHYKSQGSRSYMTPEFTRSQLVFRGVQAGTRWAEAFDVVRWIWR